MCGSGSGAYWQYKSQPMVTRACSGVVFTTIEVVVVSSCWLLLTLLLYFRSTYTLTHDSRFRLQYQLYGWYR